MKYATLIVLLLLTSIPIFAQLSCYDVQYTTSPTGDSPYNEQVVTIQGIVTVPRYYTGSSTSNYGFFIGDATGGPFSGLFVYNQSNQPQAGDLVRITGTITEYYGWTELYQISAFQTISSGNPLPPFSNIQTSALANASTAEQWESVLVSVSSVSVVSTPNNYQEFFVSDGSGQAQVDNQCFVPGHAWNNINTGTVFTTLRGVVDYAFGAFAINPRSEADLIFDNETISLSLPTITTTTNTTFSYPVAVSGLQASAAHQAYNLELSYNPQMLQYQSSDTQGTLSALGNLSVTGGNGLLNINYSGNQILQGEGILFKLNFRSTNTGISPMQAQNAAFGNTEVTNIISGSVTINSNYNSLGDTLTVIQHPILNIPEIVIPGEQMAITCLAPQNTSAWQVELSHGAKVIPLPVLTSQYVTSPNRWIITVSIPQVAVFELYNLRVRASGGIDDITRNAVHVVPTRKTNYYFAHITDLHLPNRVYYPNAGFDTDSTAVVDFRAVMDDLNLIRPEFVLITGDLINEGELEGFAGQYWYGWAQKVLSELQIPFYLTSGNHDIGGWNATPPPAGSARKNWWRYFGWSWLDNADYAWGKHTQDYSFTYGNTHFIGMESYDNYDSWRYYIYGSQSYTLNQLSWLNSTLELFPTRKKVLFHHYDFSEQLNLQNLGIDLNLWGHIHSNQGSVSTYPYSLATRSVCDGNRSYRIIRMQGDIIVPTSTIYAGGSGQNLSVSYFPGNYGIADSVRAVISNSQGMSFDNTLIKFVMPAGASDFVVYGGTLEQVDSSADKVICYVRVNLGAGSSTVAIKANSVSNMDSHLLPSPLKIESIYPNPFSTRQIVKLSHPKGEPVSVAIYDLKGRIVRELDMSLESELVWDGKDMQGRDLASGCYFYKVSSLGKSITRKTLLIRR